MEYAIEIMVGIILLVTGLSIFVRRRDWRVLFDQVAEKGHSGILMIGILNIILGPFIMTFHWNWSGWPIIVTVIGVLLTVRGIICLLYPAFLLMMLEKLRPSMGKILIVTGVFVTILGVIILYTARSAGV